MGFAFPITTTPFCVKTERTSQLAKKKKKSRKDKNGSQSYFNGVGWTMTFKIRSKRQISLGSAEIMDETEASSGLGTPVTTELFLARPYLVRPSLCS